MPPRISRPLISSQPYICPSCQNASHPRVQKSRRSGSVRSFSSTLSPRSKYAVLTNRRLLRLSGPDATNFLHDLLPAKILGVGTSPIYTAFLTAHGRILNDAFIYPPSWIHSGMEKSDQVDGDRKEAETQRSREFEWYIEVDEVGLDIMVKHFKKHKLRAKFSMEKVDPSSIAVLYHWPSDSGSRTTGDVDRTQQNYRAGGLDPRPGMGSRFLVSASHLPPTPSPQSTDEQLSVQDYTIHRILNGLAEGHAEIISGSALPQESNIDIIGGIDFHKGCYLGQELTIRTHHTGVVRKRILPCQIYDSSSPRPQNQEQPAFYEQIRLELPPPESNLSKASSQRKGRSTGKWLGGVGNIGLALCRLEMMTDIQLTADTTGYNPEEEYKIQWTAGGEDGEVKEVKIKPFVPAWVREGIEASLRRKEKKPVKKREEDDEEDEDVE